ncbi:hypothetical protein FFI89_012985 [Bradyrhizobium sp. KBS0727]|uniref:hypothetical protein n=1 Tax=unclassified Bradyrhizobium TaxID=2631580 RepID=UPI00110D2E06|nr:MULTISPECIES: hypothetical protein [unclassified Bradyrhizobium]QDW37986.1 hypothetical protein FFI71_012980 [Bradyrhizobium sp. KBS0725]QDW44590.1 hypothetical protein FFI89_012985 [Bradyrhizobium sp. KBS0727]
MSTLNGARVAVSGGPMFREGVISCDKSGIGEIDLCGGSSRNERSWNVLDCKTTMNQSDYAEQIESSEGIEWDR